MISLARIKYHKLLNSKTSPIKNIRCNKIYSDLIGNIYESYTILQDSIRDNNYQSAIYNNIDGIGTSPNKIESIYKSVSEALERWAYYAARQNTSIDAGISIDSSTNGFAAFPGLLKSACRKLAQVEAIERWTIINWWNGKIRVKESTALNSTTNCYELESLWSNTSIVILVHKHNDVYSYGFAADSSKFKAIKKAFVELERNSAAIDKYFRKKITPASIIDERLIFFSQQSGFDLFVKNMEKSKILDSKPLIPSIIFDAEVVGPWSKYATVWRVLYDCKYEFYSNDVRTFFF